MKIGGRAKLIFALPPIQIQCKHMFKPRLWTLWNTFPMVTAGSRPADPELPWGAGRPPGEGRAADGTSSPWERPAAARPARSSTGELSGHQGREEQPMVHLPHGGGRQPPGRPGAALGSWVATRGAASRRLYSLWPGSARAVLERPWEAGRPPGERRAGGCTLCGLDLPGLSWSGPGGLGRPPGSGEQSAVLSFQ